MLKFVCGPVTRTKMWLEKSQEAIDLDGSDEEDGEFLALWRLNGSRIHDAPVEMEVGHACHGPLGPT